MGKGIRTAPRDALIAESSSEADRGRSFGVHRALDAVGAAIGPFCDLAGPERRATVLGAYTFVLGLAALPASTLAGLLWDGVSHRAPFLLSAILMAAASLALLAVGSWLDRRPTAAPI